MNSMQDRQPAGTQGAGQWVAMPPKDKGKLPLLPYDFLEKSPQLSDAHSALLGMGSPYALDVIPIDRDGTLTEAIVHGSILVHRSCSECGALLSDQKLLEQMVEGDAHQVTCAECGETVEVISVRNKIGSSAEEIFEAIHEVTNSLRDDVLKGATALEQKRGLEAYKAARQRISEVADSLIKNPAAVLELPAARSEGQDVSIMVSDLKVTQLLLSVNIYPDGKRRFNFQTVRIPLPEVAVRELINNLDKAKAVSPSRSYEDMRWMQAAREIAAMQAEGND
jgi:uncharacterized Zn finger protein (UPF0148 family)